MDEATETAVDLSQYKVTILPTAWGWSWSATDPNGKQVSPSSVSLAFHEQELAEEAALDAIERHASPPQAISGEELRKRVRGS